MHTITTIRTHSTTRVSENTNHQIVRPTTPLATSSTRAFASPRAAHDAASTTGAMHAGLTTTVIVALAPAARGAAASSVLDVQKITARGARASDPRVGGDAAPVRARRCAVRVRAGVSRVSVRAYAGESASAATGLRFTYDNAGKAVRSSSGAGAGDNDGGDEERNNGIARALLTASSVIAVVCATDYAFVALGGLTWSASGGAAALRASAASAATLASAYAWSAYGGMSSVRGALGTCFTYAFGSLLSIVIVQAYKVSATCVLSAGAAAAATCAAAFLARSVASSVGAGRFGKEYDTEKYAAAMKVGAKSFERLEALREVMMREFEAEMAELNEKQSSFEASMRSVEEKHRAETARLQKEIEKWRTTNAAAAADKAKALEQAKVAFEAEKAKLRADFERETASLQSAVAAIEQQMVELEGKFAGEKSKLLEQVRAAKGLYNAQKAMFYSETTKLKTAISLQEAHASNWHAEVRKLESDKVAMIAKLEEAAKANDQKDADLVAAIAQVQAEAEQELGLAIARALSERQALTLLMSQKEDAWKVDMRSAITEAEMKVKMDMEQKMKELNSKHDETVSFLNTEWERKIELAKSEQSSSAEKLRAEMAVLKATYESSAAAAQVAHTRSLDAVQADQAASADKLRAEMAVLKATYESATAAAQIAHANNVKAVKDATERALESARLDVVNAVAKQMSIAEDEKIALVAELKAEEVKMTAELLAEKDAAIADVTKQLEMAKNERRAVYDLLQTESRKLSKVTLASLQEQIEITESKLNNFWSGKMERLAAAHSVKVQKMEKEAKNKLRDVKEDAKQELQAQLEFTVKATRAAADAEYATALANAKRAYQGERRALKALYASEVAKVGNGTASSVTKLTERLA